jgi:2-hydroxy-4-carboxymuconate semialdehyde hemiacetal dehydrogenase
MIRLAVAGEGAFGTRHLEALSRIPDVQATMLVGADPAATQALAARFVVPRWTLDLNEALAADIDGVILATPTPLHAAQAMRCLEAGKAVAVEIPMADSAEDAERLAQTARRTALPAMAGHTRRFNPSHQWVRQGIEAGRLTLRQMYVQTYFLRRSNLNALGQPRTWTDHLLWHHAAHTVDLFHFQTGETAAVARALQGPPHATLGIAMDMSIQLQAPSGALCALSLSFNNDGPLGSTFRYICDEGTFVARYDELVDGWDKPIDVGAGFPSADGIELQDREFVAAIREGRAPRSSVTDVLPAYRVLGELEKDLGG